MHKSFQRASLAAALFLLGGSVTFACSGSPSKLAYAFEHADVVVVAQLVSSELTPTDGDTSGRLVTENAVFKVMESFKGSLAKGDLLQVRTSLGPGSCGRSARNNPPWIESFDERTGKPVVPKLSGKWLIYGSGQEPYELSMLMRAAPLEYGGQDDVPELRKLRKKR